MLESTCESSSPVSCHAIVRAEAPHAHTACAAHHMTPAAAMGAKRAGRKHWQPASHPSTRPQVVLRTCAAVGRAASSCSRSWAWCCTAVSWVWSPSSFTCKGNSRIEEVQPVLSCLSPAAPGSHTPSSHTPVGMPSKVINSTRSIAARPSPSMPITFLQHPHHPHHAPTPTPCHDQPLTPTSM